MFKNYFLNFFLSIFSLRLYIPFSTKEGQSLYGLGWPWAFQESEAPRFQDSRNMKVVRLLALRTGRLYSQEIFLVLISDRGWVDPRVIGAAGRIVSMKTSIDTIGNKTRNLLACSAVPYHFQHVYIYIYIYYSGYLSRYSDWLRAGRSGIESRWGRDFPPVQTTHPLLVPQSW